MYSNGSGNDSGNASVVTADAQGGLPLTIRLAKYDLCSRLIDLNPTCVEYDSGGLVAFSTSN